MLPCSGNDLAIPHNSDLSGNHVFAILGGYLDVYPSSVAFEGGGHLDIPRPVLEVVDLGFS